jgi:hypothetical protein
MLHSFCFVYHFFPFFAAAFCSISRSKLPPHSAYHLCLVQITLQCACASSDSGEARNTLDECIRMLLSLPPVVRADILSTDSVSALLSLSLFPSEPSSPPTSFCLHASSTLHSADLLPLGAFQPPSFDALPSASAPSGQHSIFYSQRLVLLVMLS